MKRRLKPRSLWKRSRGKPTAEIASKFSFYAHQTRQWLSHLLEILSELFHSRKPHQKKARSEFEVELCQQIGQLKVELE